MNNNPLIPLAGIIQGQTRMLGSIGAPYTDLFNESAVISDVNDPLKLGRVKVTTSDGFLSGYIPVYGSNSGTLSARFIGTEVIVGKLNGRAEEMFVIGITRSNPDTGISGLPMQLPIIDESTAQWNKSTDSGMLCNEENKGRMYILSNEMNQDLVICMRKNNRQLGGKDIWTWKSLTNGIWVEKGFNPGNSNSPVITQSQLDNPGIPECNQAMLGEVHDFSEDRGFRTTTMVCRKDENKNYSWAPLGSPAVYFRTTLPRCDEKLHGVEAILDDGINSEFMVCQRYQGLMRWVRQGNRIPQRFYGKDLPLSRIDFLSSFKDISSLAESTITSPQYDWAKENNIAKVAIDSFMSNVPPTGTDERLKVLLKAANLIPDSAFDGAATLKNVAKASLESKTGIPADEIVDAITEQISRTNDVSPETKKILEQVGDAADVLVNGVKEGTVNEALTKIGLNVTQVALESVDPKLASVVTGYATNGIVGAVDTAVALGLDQLPPEVNKYVKPVVEIAKDLLLQEYPASVGNILNSASDKGLLGAISDTLNGALKTNLVTPQLLSTVVTKLTDGSLGEIPKLFNSLKNLDAVPKLSGGIDLPSLATTVLSLAGQAGELSKLLGKGGIGFKGFDEVTGLDSAKLILEGIKALKGLYSPQKKEDECPCGKKCRKTEQSEDSDGNNLLEKCGSVTKNNATGFGGDPVNNNNNPVAKEAGTSPTKIGESLVPPPPALPESVVAAISAAGETLSTPVDLTAAINGVERVKNMARRLNESRYADKTERDTEIAYTFEAIEKAIKILDNNITRMESVQKKIIDSTYNLVKTLMSDEKGLAVLPTLINDVREVSGAVQDLYKFAESLDKTKNGGSAGVRMTKNLSETFANVSNLSSLSEKTKIEATDILNRGITAASNEWNTMSPGLVSVTPLGEYGPMIPSPHTGLKTFFDKDMVRAISIESKVEDTLDIKNPVFNNILSPNQIDTLRNTAVSGVESTLYDRIIGREGETSCEQV